MSNITGEPFKDYLKKQIDLRQKIHGKGVDGNRTTKEIIYLNSRTSWVKLASSTSIDQTRLNFIPELKGSGLTGTSLAQQYILFNGTSELNTNESETTNPGTSNKTTIANLNAEGIKEGSTSYYGKNHKGASSTYSFSSKYASPRAGILGNSFNPAYGMTGNTDFGLVPMPGIESVDIKSMEMGSITRASIVLKAHNRLQFDIIDMLYLRLGYTIMLEWGDSHYLDNNNQDSPVTPMGNTLIESFWFKQLKSTTNTFKILEKIEETRKKYSSSYDGLFGRINNFNWVFNPDGSYTITLDILSMGDVVESLKANTAVYKYYNKEEKEENPNIITANKYTSVIGYIFHQIYSTYEYITEQVKDDDDNSNPKLIIQSFVKEKLGGTKLTITPSEGKIVEEIGVTIPYENILEAKLYPQYDITDESNNPGTIKWNKIKSPNTTATTLVPPVDYIKMNFQPPESSFFIRFGALMNIIETLIFPYYNEDTNNPAIKINNEVNSNLMYFIPNMVSINPMVCLISNPKFRRIDPTGTSYQYDENIMPELEPFTYTNEKNTYGRIMNIYVSFDFVLKLLGQMDKKGDVYLMGFLRNLCAGINSALGGINNLSPKIDPETNILTIFDETSVPGKNNLPDDIFKKSSLKPNEGKFNLYGYSNGSITPKNSSNFIHNVGIKTGITPEYATMISIGATAAGEVVGENSTAFSKWNTGITDRFNIDVLTSREIDELLDKENDKAKKYKAIKLNYYNTIAFKPNGENLSFLGLSKETPDFPGFFSPNVLLPIAAAISPVVSPGTNLLIAGAISLYKKQNPPSDEIQKPYVLRPELINDNLKKYQAYYKLIHNEAYKKYKKPSGDIGFMPFRLQLDMDGISGLRIYNKIDIDSKFLPSNYPETLQFLVTNITHTLRNNKWVTSIDSIATIENTVTTEELQKLTDLPKLQNNFYVPLDYKNGTLINPGSLFKSTSTQGTNANNLRNTLKSLGYIEKGVEIDNGGDITFEAERMASSVFTKIKQELPFLQVRVTGGNDYYHQQLTYVSRHASGRGIDFTISPATEANLDSVVDILKSFAKGENGNFRYIDEYRHLTKAGTADHFHISWGQGTEASKELQDAIDTAPIAYTVDGINNQNPPNGNEREEIFKNKQQEIKNINREIKQLGGNVQFNPNPGGSYNDINPELSEARSYLRYLKDKNSNTYNPTIRLNSNQL